MERKYYEAYEDRYAQVHSENLKWFSEVPSPIVGQIAEEYGINGRMLEIGCGEGRDAMPLLKQGANLLATDISSTVIQFCRSQWPEFAESFQVLDCICGRLEERFDYIFAIAVVHMLVAQSDRDAFYAFIREHLSDCGLALICSMGDGCMERETDVSRAFELQERIHEQSGKKLTIASTSYRCVSFGTFEKEIADNGMTIVRRGFTSVEPEYGNMMYAVVKRSEHIQGVL